MKHVTGSRGQVSSRMAKKWPLRWTCALLLLSLCGFTSSCPVAEKRLLVKCLESLLSLEEHPSILPAKGCRIILTFIDCVEKSLMHCQNFIQTKDIFNHAERLRAEYCNPGAPAVQAPSSMAATTTTTTTTASTTTVTKKLSALADEDTFGQTLADEGRQEIEEKFHLCRDRFTKHNPTTLEEGCRLAVTFLTCGEVVLQGYKVSLDTLYLHAELLRNRAIYLQYCTHGSSVLTGGCGPDTTRRLQACLVVTKTMIPRNPQAFCRSAPKYFSCLAEIVHECTQQPQFDHAADFLMDSIDLQQIHCLSPSGTAEGVYSQTVGGSASLLHPPEYESKEYDSENKEYVENPPPSPVSSKTQKSELPGQQMITEQAGPISTGVPPHHVSATNEPSFQLEGQDLSGNDGDDITSTSSGSEEPEVSSAVTLPWELSSGESGVRSLEVYQGSGSDVSPLEADTSGSGALQQQENHANSTGSAYWTPWQPGDLPNTVRNSPRADNAAPQHANVSNVEHWTNRGDTNKTKKGRNPSRNPKPTQNLAPSQSLHRSRNESHPLHSSDTKSNDNDVDSEGKGRKIEWSATTLSLQQFSSRNSGRLNPLSDKRRGKLKISSLAPNHFTPAGDSTENDHLQDAATGKTYTNGSSFPGQKPHNRYGGQSRKNVKGDHSNTDIKASSAKRAAVNHNPVTGDLRPGLNHTQDYSGEEHASLKIPQNHVTSSKKYQKSTPVQYEQSTVRNQGSQGKSHTLLTENETEDYVEETVDGTSDWGDKLEEDQENEEDDEEDEDVIKLSPEELAQWSRLEPWGKSCSKPWEGHSFCTSIMMTTPFGHQAGECRSLRLYISCLRGMMAACNGFPSFNSIPNTIIYISARYRIKCTA